MTRYPIWDRRAARALAEFAHHGQVDKSGAPYIHHPEAVAAIAGDLALNGSMPQHTLAEVDTVVQVAWLHDVLEDTKVDAGMLQNLGCPLPVLLPVMRLTRHKGQPAEYYYREVKDDPVALLVKRADLMHNMTPSRLSLLDQATQDRLRTKYAKACQALGIEDLT